MRLIAHIVLLLFFAPAMAQDYWIPAEEFDRHTDVELEGSLIVDDSTGKLVQLIGTDQQVRIKISKEDGFKQYLVDNPNFRVCAIVANYDSGVTNTVISKHFDLAARREHIINGNGYQLLCSKRSSMENKDVRIAGIKVLSPSEGTVKVRGVLLQKVYDAAIQYDSGTLNANYAVASNALRDYEYSRALGYLWGDGGVTFDSSYLFYPKNDYSTSKHFGSVAMAYFGAGLTENSQGTRYRVRLNGVQPSTFLAKGLPLSEIPDKKAFLTSVIETEGAVLVGRVADDPSLSRCTYIKTLVDRLNTQCAANTCTDASCSVPNCAFIASAQERGRAHQEGKNCGVYLSGQDEDWRAMFSGDDYHFVKTDRTPGGEPTKYEPGSRPAYTAN